MPKVLVMVPPHDFNGYQLSEVLRLLKEGGVVSVTASSSGQPSRGIHGAIFDPEKHWAEISEPEYDAIIFIGGAGSSEYFHSPRIHTLVQEFYKSGKPIAALDIAPSILANSNIAAGKRMTARPSERTNINAVGFYTGKPLEIDNNIITAITDIAGLVTAVLGKLKR